MSIDSPNGDHTLAEYADQPHTELTVQTDVVCEALGDGMQKERIQLRAGDMIIVSSTSPGMPKGGLAIRVTGRDELVLVSPEAARQLQVREP